MKAFKEMDADVSDFMDAIEETKKPSKLAITADFAWKVYNFINAYKNGEFGLIPLQKALDENFEDYVK